MPEQLSLTEYPKLGHVFTHFEGGRYVILKIDRASDAIWYGRVPSSAHVKPTASRVCTFGNWPVVSGQVPIPPE
jgi:hypothetical protein